MSGEPIGLLIFGGVGLLLIVIGFFCWRSARNLATNGMKTEGKVLDLIARTSSKGGRTYRPQVGFNSMDGRPMTFTSNMGTNPPRFQVGQTVPVIYLPNNPEKASINTFWELWGPTAILWGMGVLFIGISVVTYSLV